jgi:hypothetical protein
MPVAAQKRVLGRAMSPQLDQLTPVAAKAVLRLKLSEADLDRVDRLGWLANRGKLSDAQKSELDMYLQLGSLIAMMHSKARVALKRAETPIRRKSA